MTRLLICTFLLAGSLTAALPSQARRSPKSIQSLYNSLDPHSISQHLAFYELYEGTPEGEKALRDLYGLLTKSFSSIDRAPFHAALSDALEGIISLVNKNRNDPMVELSESELQLIDKLGANLSNRRLKGYRAGSEEQVLALPTNQIDLARALLLSQLGHSEETKIRSYEAAIDLMALQILSHLQPGDTAKNIIREMNRLIFEEIGFRFPPHSTYSKDVDLYTFLPSVLDSRRGVCLGVSVLYLSLAQRLNLELEIITPPGHIFVRYAKGGETINIETTARGIHLPDSNYLGVDTRALQQRTIKETVGLTWFNQAAVFWERQEYDKAHEAYNRAEKYLPQDKHLMELKACCALIQQQDEVALPLLKEVADYLPDYAVSKHTIAEDYLAQAVGKEGIESLFIPVDETRTSLLAKKDQLAKIVEKYPKFREGLFNLAGTWLQLHRMGEALDALERYHRLDSENATVEYYLAAIYAERHDYNNAWKHFRIAERLAENRDHRPKALAELRRALAKLCPE